MSRATTDVRRATGSCVGPPGPLVYRVKKTKFDHPYICISTICHLGTRARDFIGHLGHTVSSSHLTPCSMLHSLACKCSAIAITHLPVSGVLTQQSARKPPLRSTASTHLGVKGWVSLSGPIVQCVSAGGRCGHAHDGRLPNVYGPVYGPPCGSWMAAGDMANSLISSSIKSPPVPK